MENNVNQILEEIYKNPEHEGSYGSLTQLYRSVKHLGITRSQVRDYLQQQPSFSLNKKLDRVFTRPRVVVSAKNQQWDTDTCNMTKYRKYNKGYNYYAVFIDIFTRYLFTVPLKTLTAEEMKRALMSIFKYEKPTKIRSDMGSEYKAKVIERYLKSEKVLHFFATNEVKANYAERVIRTTKHKLEKIIKNKKNKEWVSLLKPITFAYNKRIHRSIKMSPLQARSINWVELWKNQYDIKERKPQRKHPPPREKKIFNFNIGDHVRISRYKSLFERAYDQKWTDEIFTITTRKVRQGIPLYTIKGWENDPIIGSFYEHELNKVYKDPSIKYSIEKVIKKLDFEGKPGYVVKWEHWEKKYNSWLNQTEFDEMQ